jgi:hypothetical protein
MDSVGKSDAENLSVAWLPAFVLEPLVVHAANTETGTVMATSSLEQSGMLE